LAPDLQSANLTNRAACSIAALRLAPDLQSANLR